MNNGSHYCPTADAMVDNETGEPVETTLAENVIEMVSGLNQNDIKLADCPDGSCHKGHGVCM